ncbi:restriction endonuclease subunit S [Rhodococcus sp. NPDC058505]|uniref:restriction endonuclease subunit S n=1 Tax=Rhodococcus sp. NPDC058505 TaxID=3346531 RepID=UPI00364F36B0
MRELVLGDSLELLIDNRGKNPPFVADGVPAVSAMNVANGVLDLNDARRVTRDIYETWMPQPIRRGDVVMTSEAPLGRVARVRSDDEICLAQRVFGLRGREGVLDTGFLYYALQSSKVQAELEGRATGTTVVGIRQSALLQAKIPAPDFGQQCAMAEVLGALDDKIAANRKLAETADLLAKAQFTSMLADSQSVPLSATAQFVNGKAFTKGASGTGRVVIRIAELNSGIGGSTVFSDIEVDDQFVARPGDLLFAWSGSLTLHRWFRDEAIVNQHIFKVIPADGYSPWLLFQLIQEKLPRFKDIAADKATTMGHIQRKHLDEPVLVPSPAQVERLEATMTALWDRALLAERESLQLTTLRDTLLPRLMSGELRVRDAEKQVEAAL